MGYGWRFVSTFPLSIGTPSLMDLCRTCAYCHSSVTSYVYQYCCLWKRLFYWYYSFLLSHAVFLTALVHSSLNPIGSDLMEMLHLGMLVVTHHNPSIIPVPGPYPLNPVSISSLSLHNLNILFPLLVWLSHSHKSLTLCLSSVYIWIIACLSKI